MKLSPVPSTKSRRPKALSTSYASGQDLKGGNQPEVIIQSILGSLLANITLEIIFPDSWVLKGNLAEAAMSWAGSSKAEAMHSYEYSFFGFLGVQSTVTVEVMILTSTQPFYVASGPYLPCRLVLYYSENIPGGPA